MPKVVEERKVAIDEKDGVRTSVVADLDILAISQEAASESAQGQQGKQLKKK